MGKEIEVQKILTKEEAADLVAKVEANIQLHQENLQEEGLKIQAKMLAEYLPLQEKANKILDFARATRSSFWCQEIIRRHSYLYRDLGSIKPGKFEIAEPDCVVYLRMAIHSVGDQIIVSNFSALEMSIASLRKYSTRDDSIIKICEEFTGKLDLFCALNESLIDSPKAEHPKSAQLIPVPAEEEGFQWSPSMACIAGACCAGVVVFLWWLTI